MDNTTTPQTDREIPKDVMTALPNGGKVRKDDLHMVACGEIDELNSFIGLLATVAPIDLVDELHLIQRRLFAVGAYVAGAPQVKGLPSDAEVDRLKQRIADFQSCCGKMTSFVLPGGCQPAAWAHVCRSVCRRAERATVNLEAYAVVPYMNRLSTYFFYLALYLNYFYNTKEINL